MVEPENDPKSAWPVSYRHRARNGLQLRERRLEIQPRQSEQVTVNEKAIALDLLTNGHLKVIVSSAT
jgi:hypothetical protein